MTDLRDELFDVVDKHSRNPRVLSEVLLLAATTCLSAGMTPEQGSRTFNEILAAAFRTLNHKDLSPLAQVVIDEA
tara:strand:- start:596 stop:820 length:225 start_codon:yes stop_codon:yes gene_type:complete